MKLAFTDRTVAGSLPFPDNSPDTLNRHLKQDNEETDQEDLEKMGVSDRLTDSI